MKILTLSAYDATSHRMWREGLSAQFDQIAWTHLTLPARHFRWRKRSNPLTWFFESRETLTDAYDLVLATNTVDASTIRGLVPSLATTPWILYFHDNQFSYPQQDGSQKTDAALAMLDVYNALSARHVVFNSEYNRTSMIDGIALLRNMMPDHFPSELETEIQRRSTVIPVGIDDEWFGTHQPTPRRILWNHRWEWDKNPSVFAGAIEMLAEEEGEPFDVVLAGPTFRDVPDAFAELKRNHPERLVQYGTVESVQDYRALASTCDVVVSTAFHEFQGLAMIEAIAAGCVPIAPNRLAYPEYIPKTQLYESSPDEPEKEIRRVVESLKRAFTQRPAPPDVSRFRWSTVSSLYDKLFSAYF